jgi:uncharacterized protein (TIGR03435 family)
MTHPKQSLHEFLDQSFARFRALPSNGVESACDRVLDRLEKETDRTPEAFELRPRASRRYGRMVVLIAATAAVAVFAQQSVTRLSTAPPVVKEEVVTPPRAPETAALVQQPTPEATRPAPAVARARVEFTAASIKPVAPGTTIPGAGLACRGTDGVQRLVLTVTSDLQDAVRAPLGRCVGVGIFLSTLIQMAYGVSPKQISGGPDWSRVVGSMMSTGDGRGAFVSLPVRGTREGFSWARNESFQLEATADNPSTATLAQLQQMLRAMLADRFNLRYHLERNEMPGYALVIAEGGHKLKAISGDYVESLVLFRGRSTMETLTRSLSSFLLYDVPLVDKTGLEGAYEYAFELLPPNPQAGARGIGGGGAGPGVPPSIAERAENLSNQLEQQLGLRLQAEKAISVETLVIDSVEPPSPN